MAFARCIGVLACLWLLGAAGCTSLDRGPSADFADVQGRVLRADGARGSQRLEIEREADAVLRAYVARHGSPDYLFVESRTIVILIYLADDVLATFERGSGGAQTRVTTASIPAPLRARLEGEDPRTGPKKPPKLGGPGTLAGTGTCFSVHPSGLLLTSHHVVAGSSRVLVVFPGEEPTPARLRDRDVKNDLALLQMEHGRPSYLSLGSPQLARLGEQVFTIGYPSPQLLGFDPKFTEGVVSSVSGLGGDPTSLQLTIPIQPGNSGGPVLNMRGRVLGVVAATANRAEFEAATGAAPQNINWAVKAEYAAPLFEAPDAREITGERVEVVAAVSEATCLVVTFE